MIRAGETDRRSVFGLSFVAVLIGGFGVMNMLWFSGSWPTNRGLWDYRSATLGDGVLLPFAFAMSVTSLYEAQVWKVWRSYLLRWFLGGIVAASILIALWLLDPDPALNWTMPRPHSFNLPGWYHAVFLVFVSGLFSAVLAGNLRLMGEHHSPDKKATGPAFELVTVSLVAFGGLLTVDASGDFGRLGSQAALLTFAAATVAAAGLLIAAVRRAAIEDAAIRVARALAAGLGLALLTLYTSAHIPYMIPIAATSVGVPLFLSGDWNKSHASDLAARVLMAALFIAGGLVAALTVVDHAAQALVLGLIPPALTVFLFLDTVSWRLLYDLLLTAAATCTPALAVVAAAHLSVAGSDPDWPIFGFGVGFGAIVGIASSQFAQMASHDVWLAGRDRSDLPAYRPVEIWLKIGGLMVPAVFGMMLLASAKLPTGPSGVDGLGLAGWRVGIALFATLWSVFALIHCLRTGRSDELLPPKGARARAPFSTLCVLALPSALLVVAYGAAGDIVGYRTESLVAAAVYGGLTFNFLFATPLWTQLVPPAGGLRLIPVCGGLASAVATIWLGTSGLWVEGEPAFNVVTMSRSQFFVVTVASVSIMTGIGLSSLRGYRHPSKDPPETGVVQDILQFTALLLAAFVVPASLEGSPGVVRNVLAAFLAVAAFPVLNGAAHVLSEWKVKPVDVEKRAGVPSGSWTHGAVQNDVRRRRVAWQIGLQMVVGVTSISVGVMWLFRS